MIHEKERFKTSARTNRDLIVAASILEKCKYYRIRKVTTEWLGGSMRHAVRKNQAGAVIVSREPEFDVQDP